MASNDPIFGALGGPQSLSPDDISWLPPDILAKIAGAKFADASGAPFGSLSPAVSDEPASFDARWGVTPDTFGARWGDMAAPQAQPAGGSRLGRGIGQRAMEKIAGLGGVATHMAEGLLDYYKTPGDLLAGKFTHQPDTPGVWSEYDQEAANRGADQMTRRAPQMALETLGIASPFAQRGAAGVFGGRLAATADKAALARAEEMAATGAPRERIWNDTGWFQGPDQKWRFEIPDQGAKFKYSGEMKNWRLGDAVDHPQLFEAYPWMKDMPLSTNKGSSSWYMPGLLNKERGSINLNTRAGPPEITDLLHETQHAVQNKEGFSRGTSSAYEHGLFTWPTEESIRRAKDRYLTNPGEMEARNVEARFGQAVANDRTNPPWQTQPVPDTHYSAPGDLTSQQKALARALDEERAGKAAPTTDEALRLIEDALNIPRGASASEGGKLVQPQGIRAYHASPHDFDKFDMSKVGTGLGHGYVGEGMNFTSSQAKAEAMRDQYFPGGKVYEANLNADPNKMLDIQKRLSEQPHVQQVFDKAGIDPADALGLPPFAAKTLSGKDALRALEAVDVPQWRQLLNDPMIGNGGEAVRKFLVANGIPGVKNIDQHVIMDDKLIDILRKYGIVGMLGGTGMMAAPPDSRAPFGSMAP